MRSFIDLVRVLLQEGMVYILSDKLNQDSLEEHFGRQRQKGGGNQNPTVEEYGQNEVKLQVAKSQAVRVMRGNTRGKERDNNSYVKIDDVSSLAKRQKKK